MQNVETNVAAKACATQAIDDVKARAEAQGHSLDQHSGKRFTLRDENRIPMRGYTNVSLDVIERRLREREPSQIDSDVVKAGKDAFKRLTSTRSWDDWMLVAEAIAAGQDEIARIAGTSKGRYYAVAMNKWLKKTGFDAIDDGARSRLMKCFASRAEIETWRNGLPAAERLKHEHPQSVLNAWNKATKPPKPKATTKSKANEAAHDSDAISIAELEGYVQELREKAITHEDFFDLDTVVDKITDRVPQPDRLKELADRLAQRAAALADDFETDTSDDVDADHVTIGRPVIEELDIPAAA
jgi:hypothetical protein